MAPEHWCTSSQRLIFLYHGAAFRSGWRCRQRHTKTTRRGGSNALLISSSGIRSRSGLPLCARPAGLLLFVGLGLGDPSRHSVPDGPVPEVLAASPELCSALPNALLRIWHPGLPAAPGLSRAPFLRMLPGFGFVLDSAFPVSPALADISLCV